MKGDHKNNYSTTNEKSGKPNQNKELLHFRILGHEINIQSAKKQKIPANIYKLFS